MNEQLPQLLTDRLAGALPGPMVGSRFESRTARCHDRSPPDARRAAVMILLYPHRGGWHLPLTLRQAHLADHAGQVSLPGGAIDPGETSRQAAVRELYEEIAVEPSNVALLGRLSPVYVEVSNFLITPWVAFSSERPPLTPNPDEVEEVIEVPLAHLLDADNFGSQVREYRGRCYTAPHFAWQSHRIWGATCMILGELVTVLEPLGV